MKKLILVIACFVVLAFGVNAIELSAGIGADVGFIFTSTKTNIPQPYKSELNATLDNAKMTRWGISAFFDAQYIEANLGAKFFVLSYSEAGYKYEETDNFFNFGLKFKYPFKITETIYIFPLAGFDYSIFTSGKAKDNTGYLSIDRDYLLPSNAIDRFSINVGVGGDFYVGQNVYIRGEFNYAFLLNTKGQKESIEQIESMGYDLSIFQSGPVFKLAVGYRFFQ
jgi:hypothetical protein